MDAVAITGTGGYIGGRLAGRLRDKGVPVVRLSRSTDADVRFDLSGPAIHRDEFLSRRVGALVHAAYDFSGRTATDVERHNVVGTLNLFDVAQKAGVRRVVFLSSLAAHPACRSHYGRAKRAVEERVGSSAVVIKPGTVYGPSAGGMMGGLVERIAGSRVVPVIRHPGAIYLTHEADLFRLIEEALTGDVPSAPFFAAAETPWTMDQISRVIGGTERQRVYVPAPWRAVWASLKLLEACGGAPRLRSDSALSLGYPATREYVSGLARGGFTFRDFSIGSL